MNIKQLLELIVRPTLKEIGLHSVAAEQLIIGTICQESRGVYIKQLGSGPALGLIQMEPATHNDIWLNYLAYHPHLKPKITDLISHNVRQKVFKDKCPTDPFVPPATELIANLKYAVAMCRIHYLRVPEPLPEAGDIAGFSRYWKKYYNTISGEGLASEFFNNYPGELL